MTREKIIQERERLFEEEKSAAASGDIKTAKRKSYESTQLYKLYLASFKDRGVE